MKQIITMICCVGIILVSGVYEIRYLDKTATYFMSDMEYIQNAINNNNYELASEHMKNFSESWNNVRTIWNIFVNHEEVDNIEEAMIELKNNIEFKDDSACKINIEKIKNNVTHSAGRQKLKLDNIL